MTEVQHHKPQHYDKFETGVAYQDGTDTSNRMSLSERIMADYSREELQAMMQKNDAAAATAPQQVSSPTESSASSSQISPRHHVKSNPHEEFVRKKSPSAKVRERTKAKQQQLMKSVVPPPSAVAAAADLAMSSASSVGDASDVMDGSAVGLHHEDLDSDTMNDLIEQKWKEVSSPSPVKCLHRNLF